MKHTTVMISVLVALLALTGGVQAKTTTLTSSPGDWATDTDWSAGSPDAAWWAVYDTVNVGLVGGNPATVNCAVGYGFGAPSQLNVTDGAVVNFNEPGACLWLYAANAVNLDAASQINVAGTMYLRHDGTMDNLAFASAPTNGKVSVSSTSTYLNVGDEGQASTLTIDSRSSGAQFAGFGVGGNAVLNINAATVGFNDNVANWGGVLNITGGAVVNVAGISWGAWIYGQINIDGDSQFNMVNENSQLYFRQEGAISNIVFTNAPANGKFSITAAGAYLNIGDEGQGSTLTIDSRSTGAQFAGLGTGPNSVLNVNAATVGFTNDAFFGGTANLTNGAFANVGGTFFMYSPTGVNLDGTSKVNVAGNNLYFRHNGVSNTLAFANTPTAGKISVPTSAQIIIGDQGESATLTMTGPVTVATVSVGSSAALNYSQTDGQTEGLTVGGSSAGALAMGSSGVLTLAFDTVNVGGRDWAFRWLGDHVSALTALGSRFSWSGGPTGAAIGISYDSGDGYTYVGYSSVSTGPHLKATPASGATHDWGIIPWTGTATTTTKSALIENDGAGGTLNVTAANFGGTGASFFAIDGGFTTAALASGEGRTYNIKFTGTLPGNYDASVTFVTDMGDVTYSLLASIGAAGLHMGDANGDHKVDLQDFSLLKAYYSLTGQGWNHGNFNSDANGLVNLEDFSLLKAHYNHTGDASNVPLTAVPEPATLALAALAALALRRRRR